MSDETEFADWYVRTHSEPRNRDVLVRTFEVELEENTEGRTLDGLCVPYGVAAMVADPPDYMPYQEVFVKGAFARAVKAPNRVYLNFEHRDGISNVLGHGVTFEERDDGLYGSLEIDAGPDGDKALRMYRQRVLTSLSVEFKPMGKSPNIDGVVQRKNVHLDAVALCRIGAYPEAQVLAVRTDPLIQLARLPFDQELAASLAANGLAVPDRLRTEIETQ